MLHNDTTNVVQSAIIEQIERDMKTYEEIILIWTRADSGAGACGASCVIEARNLARHHAVSKQGFTVAAKTQIENNECTS